MAKELLMELDPDERVIRSTKRHAISAVMIIIVAAVLFVMATVALFLGIRNSEEIGISDYKAIYALIIMALMVLIGLFAWVAVYLDRKNELIVTNENIIQLLQFGIFNKQVSQLNLAKIQDVSVDQNGLLANAFNFGVVEVETAGEVANFRFLYTPDPNRMAKAIIEAHEDYIKNYNTQSGTGHI